MKRPTAESSCSPLFSLVALCLLVALTIGVAFWGSSRGFDLTDEGVYYLEATYPGETRNVHTAYYYVNRAALQLLDGDIAMVRRAALLTLFGSAWVFHFGAVRFLQALGWSIGRREGIGLYLLLALSSLLGVSWTPLAFSYNTINAMLLMAVSGLALFVCGAARSSDVRAETGWTVCALAAAFVGIGLDWFIKPSTALALLVLCGFLIVAASGLGPRRLVALGALAAGSIALGLAIALLVFGSSEEWLRRLAIIRLAASGSSGGLLVRNTLLDLGEIGVATVRDHWLMLCGSIPMVALLAARGRSAITGRGKLVAGGAAGAAAIADVVVNRAYLGGGFPSGFWFVGLLAFYLSVLLLLGICVVAAHWLAPSTDGRGGAVSGHDGRAWTGLLLFLLALPPAGAFGSGNPIPYNALFQMAPWFLVAWILLRKIACQWRAKALATAGTLLLAILATSQFATGYILTPYNLPSNLLAQTKTTAIGPDGAKLLLSPDCRRFIKRVRRTLQNNGFETGDDILAFYNLPGLVFAVGGCSPGHSWYFGDYRAGAENDRESILKISPDRLSRAFILMHGDKALFTNALAENGMNFPEDYKLCRTVRSPYTGEDVSVWAPLRR